MALINCPECKKEVSDTAPTCPNCGYSFRAVTVEQTGKTWKLVTVMAILMFIVGLSLMSNKDLEGVAWALVDFGVIFFIASKIGRWWNNR